MSGDRQLFVVRHAKSSWDDPMLDDHERPLAPRGLKAVRVLADYIRDSGIQPAQVLCSSSRRTRETLDGIKPGGEALIEDQLYGATCGSLIERLRQVPQNAPSVMVIGHNPAMQMLVLKLVGAHLSGVTTPMGADLAEVQRKFPTGALATLTFSCGWGELGAGCATLVAYVRPKALR